MSTRRCCATLMPALNRWTRQCISSQQNAETTEFRDGFFDLHVSHILVHETGNNAIRTIARETNRLRGYGGLVVQAETSPYRDLSACDTSILNWRLGTITSRIEAQVTHCGDQDCCRDRFPSVRSFRGLPDKRVWMPPKLDYQGFPGRRFRRRSVVALGHAVKGSPWHHRNAARFLGKSHKSRTKHLDPSHRLGRTRSRPKRRSMARRRRVGQRDVATVRHAPRRRPCASHRAAAHRA